VVAAEPGGGLAVSGMDASVIGRLAAEHDIAVYELATRHASLEEAYLELTDGSVDYRAVGHAHHLRHPREDS
jgi:ABC-2 type transport system ATP-binding protein